MFIQWFKKMPLLVYSILFILANSLFSFLSTPCWSLFYIPCCQIFSVFLFFLWSLFVGWSYLIICILPRFILHCYFCFLSDFWVVCVEDPDLYPVIIELLGFVPILKKKTSCFYLSRNIDYLSHKVGTVGTAQIHWWKRCIKEVWKMKVPNIIMCAI